MPLYGSRTRSRMDLRDAVAGAFGVELEGHDSLYWGEYELAELPEGHVKVLDNFEDFDGELLEPDFPEHSALILVEGAPAAVAEAVGALEGVELLNPER